ncbi:Protein of unknown function [Pyronema omphalodes CBS 100304]|uniref:Uncharacterized protein n=1 Tax=Pyronema omphalodes (strain CBS 100304) TaxID=1076935 RepID=U4LFT2_PYROM|nr:Protein of unknown function [Pyronema omphalodes CBS 100304]
MVASFFEKGITDSTIAIDFCKLYLDSLLVALAVPRRTKAEACTALIQSHATQPTQIIATDLLAYFPFFKTTSLTFVLRRSLLSLLYFLSRYTRSIQSLESAYIRRKKKIVKEEDHIATPTNTPDISQASKEQFRDKYQLYQLKRSRPPCFPAFQVIQ